MTLDDTISTLIESARENGLPNTVVSKLVADLRKAAEDAKASKEPVVKTKTQLAILVSDPEGRLKGMELVGWVVSLEESAAPQSAYTRILEAATDFGNSARGRKASYETLGDAIGGLKGKWLKRSNPAERLTIPKASRHPIAIQAVPNKLPR